MKLRTFFDTAIKLGIQNGPRTPKEIARLLKEVRDDYDKLSDKEKKNFDMESLTNPFLDSRIVHGDPDQKVSIALAGIDVEESEILMAAELNRRAGTPGCVLKKGEQIDLLAAHHPVGRGLIDLTKVMNVQADVFVKHGVPVNIAEKLLEPRIRKIARGLSPVNHYRAVDIARLLGFAYVCLHTVADNQVHAFLEKYMEKKKPYYVKDVMDALLELPEFAEAVKRGDGPILAAGLPKSRAGTVAVTGMTGGTEGTDEIYERLAQAGVGTVIEMHMSENHKDKAEKHHLNVIISGHIPSDSLGMNLLLDPLERKGVRIIPCGGMIRIRRKKWGMW